MAACTVIVDRLDDGRHRATCPVFPDLEVVAASEEVARQALERAIEIRVRGQLGLPPESTKPPL